MVRDSLSTTRFGDDTCKRSARSSWYRQSAMNLVGHRITIQLQSLFFADHAKQPQIFEASIHSQLESLAGAEVVYLWLQCNRFSEEDVQKAELSRMSPVLVGYQAILSCIYRFRPRPRLARQMRESFSFQLIDCSPDKSAPCISKVFTASETASSGSMSNSSMFSCENVQETLLEAH